MNLKHVFVLASMMGLGMVGCTTDEGVLEEEILPEIEKSEEVLNYEEAFADAFGTIDPSHTWNTATRGNAEVSVGYEGNYTLKLYTSNPRITSKQAYLLGEFPIEGNSSVTIEFDMPGTLETVYASLVDEEGHRVIKPAKLNNGTLFLNFGGVPGSRVVTSTDTEILKVSETDPWVYEKKDWEIPLETLPEEVNALGKEGISENFLYRSHGPFIVYPMYFWTSNTSMELGIYYYDDNDNKIEQAIWHKDEAFRFYHKYKEWKSYNPYPGSPGYWEEKEKWSILQTSEHWGSEGWTFSGWSIDNEWNWFKNPTTRTDLLKMECEGILINIQPGLKFGFYITNGNRKFYSESKHNEKTGNNPIGCYAATFYSEEGNLYLAYEDWYDHTTLDFNDLVCKIGNPENIEIVDENTPDTPMEYIIAYEDLGYPDFDFNDLVMSVSHVSGLTKAYVKALAVGGSLPVYASYSSASDVETPLFGGKEIHQAFGAANEGDKNDAALDNGCYYPVNISGDPNAMSDVNPIFCALDVPNTFSIADEMKNFKIKMVRNPGDAQEEISTIGPPSFAGNTPQAFLIADPEWEWPAEFQNIKEKYTEFEQWASNPAANWYEAKWETPSEDDPNQGDGNEGGGTGGEPEIVPGEDYGTLIENFEVKEGQIFPAEMFANASKATVTFTNVQGCRIYMHHSDDHQIHLDSGYGIKTANYSFILEGAILETAQAGKLKLSGLSGNFPNTKVYVKCE
ncbi:MAG: hypothetical protein E7095_06825 [Bacteroides sp.]|nr:hypothetical protein [Bacteroides sp.]